MRTNTDRHIRTADRQYIESNSTVDYSQHTTDCAVCNSNVRNVQYVVYSKYSTPRASEAGSRVAAGAAHAATRRQSERRVQYVAYSYTTYGTTC